MPTLEQLDTAFNDLWLHTDQLPSLLEKWQERVREHLVALGGSKAALDAFEERMLIWQQVLKENRALVQAHQSTLKGKLKIGEPDLSKQMKTKNYIGH